MDPTGSKCVPVVTGPDVIATNNRIELRWPHRSYVMYCLPTYMDIYHRVANDSKMDHRAEVAYSQCYYAIKNKDFKIDLLVFVVNIIFGVIRTVIEFIFGNILFILSIVLLYYALKLLYRAYISPVVYKKELTEIGFEHIPPGPDRDKNIARAQAARKRSNKIPPPYPNGWFALAESKDLKVGDVVAIDALGQSLCVYRGEDGVARCVDAYCPHLGAHLGVGGTVCGNCIECPFHKWKFDENGTCVSVPGIEKAPRGVSIKQWRTVEADGAVWIWYDAEGREPLWELEEPPEIKDWGYRGRNEYVVSVHIQEIPENAADPAHLNVVHTPSLLTSLGKKYPLIADIIGCHVWTGDWTKNEDHTATMYLTHDYRIMKCNIGHFKVNVTQIGPGHVRLMMDSVFGPVFITQSVTPIGPLLQRVVHRMYSPARSALFAVIVVKSEGDMFERDTKVWNNKMFVNAPAYVKTDKTIRTFRTWFSQFYTDHSISYRDATQNTLDW